MKRNNNLMLIVYLAGFFDGRGCFSIRKDKKKYVQFKIKLSGYKDNYTIKHIENLLRELGINYIIDSKGLLWITTRSQVKKFAEMLLPYMSIKKKEVSHFIDELNKYAFQSGSN